MNNKIYRLRPVGDKTIEELTEPYLWFSRPTEYKDFEDANVIAFSEKNKTVKELFEQIFEDAKDLGKELSRLGMCCFTKYLPPSYKWKKFPQGHNAIFIEYDKKILKDHFSSKLYLGNCFKEITYKENPLILKSSDKNGYDVLWKETKDGKYYKSLRGDIGRDSKLMEEFILRFFTTINKHFHKQKEIRIILSYRIIKDYPEDVLGYKINIPKEAIKKIYYNQDTDTEFINSVQKMGFPLEMR